MRPNIFQPIREKTILENGWKGGYTMYQNSPSEWRCTMYFV